VIVTAFRVGDEFDPDFVWPGRIAELVLAEVLMALVPLAPKLLSGARAGSAPG